MGRFVHLFPLSVYRDSLTLPEPYRQSLVARVLEMEQASAERAKEGSAWLGDVKGYEFLFQEPLFHELYRQMAAAIERYIVNLGMDSSRIDFYYQRSWATVSRGGEQIHQHAHEQSNLSVAYYLQKPPQSGGIQFVDENHPNEFSRGLFSPSKIDLGLIRQPGMLTWNAVVLEPEEGELVIFPSKTQHATMPNASDQPRISISADITTMLRDSFGHETMMPHFSNWRGFGDYQ